MKNLLKSGDKNKCKDHDVGLDVRDKFSQSAMNIVDGIFYKNKEENLKIDIKYFSHSVINSFHRLSYHKDSKIVKMIIDETSWLLPHYGFNTPPFSAIIRN